ncbi:MAG: hypothetical protein LBU84_07335 [Prevotella sp.]|jgi:hypothetical protein|nr:hypothetical protein [Prevotella sp.]
MNTSIFKKIYWLSLLNGADKLFELRDCYKKYTEENISTADHRFLKILVEADYDPEEANIILFQIKRDLKLKSSLGMP